MRILNYLAAISCLVLLSSSVLAAAENSGARSQNNSAPRDWLAEAMTAFNRSDCRARPLDQEVFDAGMLLSFQTEASTITKAACLEFMREFVIVYVGIADKYFDSTGRPTKIGVDLWLKLKSSANAGEAQAQDIVNKSEAYLRLPTFEWSVRHQSAEGEVEFCRIIPVNPNLKITDFRRPPRDPRSMQIVDPNQLGSVIVNPQVVQENEKFYRIVCAGT